MKQKQYEWESEWDRWKWEEEYSSDTSEFTIIYCMNTDHLEQRAIHDVNECGYYCKLCMQECC